MTPTTPKPSSVTPAATGGPTPGSPTDAVGPARLTAAYRTLPPVARDFVRMTSRSGKVRNSMILRLAEEQFVAWRKLP